MSGNNRQVSDPRVAALRTRGWKIVDARTGVRSTVGTYFTREQAERQITEWQDRHERGGRPDITREMLLNMEPRPEDGGE